MTNDHGLRGMWVATATPLTAEDTIDHAELACHVRRLLSKGCDGIVLFGTTGEGPSFGAAERLKAVEALLSAGIETGRLAISTTFPAMADTIELTRQALKLGLIHALLLPPYFYRDVSPDGLEASFTAVLEGVGDDRLRALLYHIPQVSGVAIPPAIVASLRSRFGPVLAGVKDSSGDFEHFLSFRKAAPDVDILVGNEADIARAMAQGGAGTISGIANAAPCLVRGMFQANADDTSVRKAIGTISGPFVPFLKAVLADTTGREEWRRVRAPLTPNSSEQGKSAAEIFRSLEQEAGGGV